MATIREYFDKDIKIATITMNQAWEIHDCAGTLQGSITARIIQDFDGNAKYWSFFLPAEVPAASVINIFKMSQTAQCDLLKQKGCSVNIKMGIADYSEQSSSDTLVFTKRILLYIDALLSPENRQNIAKIGSEYGFNVIVRDHEYAIKLSATKKPLAFVSHDSRDKDSLVRELVLELSLLDCPVWYDEYSLNVGDSLRANIEKGLKETPKCVVVLSPNFISNNGWGKAEFDSIYTREILEKKNVMLPIWHNIGVQEVYEYSPRMADKVGLSSSLGAKELAKKLSHVIKK